MGSVFHEMTDEELVKEMDEAHSEIRELRFTFAVARSLQDPGRIRRLRRNIAAILTVQKERADGKATIKEKSGKKKKKDKKKAKA